MTERNKSGWLTKSRREQLDRLAREAEQEDRARRTLKWIGSGFLAFCLAALAGWMLWRG